MKLFAALLVLSVVGLSSASFGFGSFTTLLTTTAKPKVNKGNVAASSSVTATAQANLAAQKATAAAVSTNAQKVVAATIKNQKVVTASVQQNVATAINQVQSNVDTLQNNLNAAAAKGKGQLSAQKESITEDVKGTLEKVSEVAKEKYGQAVETAKSALESIKNNEKYQKIQSQVESGLDATKQAINEQLNSHPQLAANIEKVEEKISEGISAMKKKYQEKAAPLVNEGVEVAKKELSKAKQEIEQNWPEWKEKAGKLASSVKSSFGSKLKNWGIGV